MPEERAIFRQLTAEENLTLAAVTAPKALSLDRMLEFFPVLKERRRSAGKQLFGRRGRYWRSRGR